MGTGATVIDTELRARKEFIADLYGKYGKKLQSFAYRLTGDWHIAEDVVQEVFLLAFVRFKDLAELRNPPGWLYKALYFTAIRENAKKYRTEVFVDDISAIGIDPHSRDQYQRLEYILPKELSGQEQELLVLRYEWQWSYEELAEYYGLTQEACRQRVHRVGQKCKKLFEKNSKTLSQTPYLNGYSG